MRGPGRPKKLDGELLEKVVGIRVTEEERELLERARDGKLSDWSRRVLVREAKRVLGIKDDGGDGDGGDGGLGRVLAKLPTMGEIRPRMPRDGE